MKVSLWAEIRRLREIELTRFWPNPSLPRLIWTVSAVGQFSLALGVIGFPPGRASALYFAALYLNLVNAGLLFLVVAWHTFVPKE